MMAARTPWTRWFHWTGLFARRDEARAGRRAHDFADLGTAFGLDMSLSSPPEAAPASQDTASGAAARPPAGAPSRR